MPLVRMQLCSEGSIPTVVVPSGVIPTGVVPADVLPTGVAEHADASGPRVRADMTVEVALSVMAGARVGYLLVIDADDQCTDSVTEAQLAAVRDGAAYSDRLRVRDVIRLRRNPDALAPV
ncbi:CBS domain-containing protein [Streptomyces sp. NBC_00151]|uniref:CBS domain-containing protein n=1 Tax=Streptomyces sp. NBC_00151 TaxID=2975669 RepID=UPI003FA3C72C